ncbi:MAG: hypothetical protein U9Q66_04520 [Patescibacteria group bacterium]|nr:hypothetical protein [Patescibacteria group bacterium]
MLVESLNGKNVEGGVQIVLASQEIYFIGILILFLIGYIISLIFKNGNLTKNLGFYKDVYQSVYSQYLKYEEELSLKTKELDNFKKDSKNKVSLLHANITKIESELYIYLKDLDKLKTERLEFEVKKGEYLYDIVSKLFDDKTQNFIKLIDSETLDDKEKVEFFKTFFADIIPLIKDRDSSLENIGN